MRAHSTASYETMHPDRLKGLARISRQRSAATARWYALTGVYSVGMLDLIRMPFLASARSYTSHSGRLNHLATNAGEIYDLAMETATGADNPGMFSRYRPVRLPGLILPSALLLFAATTAVAEGNDAPKLAAKGNNPSASPGIAISYGRQRERTILELIERKALPEEFLVLGAPELPFIVRFERARGPTPQGALLFVPSRGTFVGNDEMTDAFFRGFPVNGWSVLAVQPTLLARGASLDEYEALAETAVGRIRDAIQFLIDDGISRIVMAGDSAGATLMRQCLQNGVPREVSAFAALGMWQGEIDDLPMLELIGARDERAVTSSGHREKDAARRAFGQYRLIVLGGADARYLGFEDEIAQRIRGWAERLSLHAAVSRDL